MKERELRAGAEEIEQDRRVERGLLLQALGALAVVAAFVLVRTLIVG